MATLLNYAPSAAQGHPYSPMGGSGRPVILVVDDVPENIEVLAKCLEDDYEVRPALGGIQALSLAGCDPTPDLILLDMAMPGMDGYEVLRRLKANPVTADIPVIIVTALTAVCDEVHVLSMGAVDFIARPVIPSIVKARLHSHLALAEARRMLALQNRHLLQERHLVEDILTRLRETESFNPAKLRYLLASVDRCDGDILLAAFTPDGRQWVLVGDMAGHGPAAAVAAPLIGHLFYSRAEEGGDAGSLLEELNEVMFQRLPLPIFMAFSLVEVSPGRDALRVWNGGLPGCFCRSGRGHLRSVESCYFPLGMAATLGEVDGDTRLPFHPQDRFYLFTDGLSECENDAGQAFGDEAVLALLARLGPQLELEDMRLAVARFHGSEFFRDDLTLVELRS